MSERLVKVTVTADDVREGVRYSCDRCPVARALRRAFPGCVDAYVGKSWVGTVVYPGGRIVNYLLPGPVSDLIHEYDRGARMAPFTFALGLREET